MNKNVKNFFVGLFVFMLCSCAQKQTQPVVRGSFAPGVFIKNRLKEAGNLLRAMGGSPKNTDENIEQVVQPVVKSEIIEIKDQKNVQKIPGTSVVRISTGDYKKRKYIVVK